MRFLTRTLTLAAVAAAIAAAPASAANPATGKISLSAPETKWTGEAAGYGVSVVNNFANTAEQACEAPFCDSFALEVADSADLVVTAVDTDQLGFVQIDLVKPDGTYVYNGGEADKASTITLKNAPAGAYTVRVLTNSPVGFDASYNASAKLVVPKPVVEEAEPAVPATPAANAPVAQQPAAKQPAAAAPVSVTVKTTKASARKAKKGLAVALASSGALTDVVVTLKKGAKKAGAAKLASLNGSGKALVKARGLKAGSYTIVVTGKDAAGRVVTTTAKLKVTR